MSPESTAPTGQALPAGTRLEEFEVERVLGSGGFGITYLARDVKLGRQVVIKENLPAQFAFRDPTSLTVSPRNTEGEDADNFAWSLENFSREASMLASLDHPGIVQVLRKFESFGTSYFVMPYMEGLPLDELMKNRRERGEEISDDELRGLLEHVLDALGYLHARGIYHRDIKPGNILVTKEGVPILIDFGSARQRLSERSMTVVESAGYTPFEQLQSRGNVGPWSDLYSLGGTVAKAITGEAPPKATDRAFDDPWVPLSKRADLRERYSGELLESIDRALDPQVSPRFQDAGEWLGALQGGQLASGEEESVPPVPAAKPEPSSVEVSGGPAGEPVSGEAVSPEPKGKGKGMLVAVGAATLLLIVGVGVALTGNNGAEEERVRLAQEEKLAAQKKTRAAEAALAAQKKVEEERMRLAQEEKLAAQKKTTAAEAARKKAEAEVAAQSKLVAKPGPGEQYSWEVSTIDSEGEVGRSSSLAFSPSGHPVISYYDSTNGALKYATYDGRKWALRTIESEGHVGRYPSLAFSPSGQPAISYYDSTNDDLKYASFDGQKWTPQTIDREGNVGWFTSLAFSPSGHPAISYYDWSNDDLKYASFDGQKWTPQTIDREGNVGWSSSLAFSPSGHPAISYSDFTNYHLKYASFDGRKWALRTIDREGHVGRYPSLAFSTSGQPAISYYDSTNDNLKYASFDGQKWTPQTIDREGNIGRSTSLAFSPSGHPAISYSDFTNYHLKYASFDGQNWTPQAIDREGDVGGSTSLAFSPSGQPAISYYDSTNGDLKYAHRVIVKKGSAGVKSAPKE